MEWCRLYANCIPLVKSICSYLSIIICNYHYYINHPSSLSECCIKQIRRTNNPYHGNPYTGTTWSLYWDGLHRSPFLTDANWSSVHYSDVIMSAMVSQITVVSNVCSTVCSGANQPKHQSSTSLAFVRGIHRWPGNNSGCHNFEFICSFSDIQ